MPPFMQAYTAQTYALMCVVTGFLFLWHGTQALLPIQNRGELAVLYCFTFLYISSQGSGIWSVDAARGQREKMT